MFWKNINVVNKKNNGLDKYLKYNDHCCGAGARAGAASFGRSRIRSRKAMRLWLRLRLRQWDYT
jgi:hypothetical protein